MTEQRCKTCGHDKRHLCPFHPVRTGTHDDGAFKLGPPAPCRDICEGRRR